MGALRRNSESATSAGPLAISQSTISPLLSANWPMSLGFERLWVRRWCSASKNENALDAPLTNASRALLTCERPMGREPPDENNASVVLDDSIVQDTTSEKCRDMDEVATELMDRAKYRRKWYGES